MIATLQLFDHHILGVVETLLSHHSFMNVGIKGLTLHPHRSDAQLFQDINELLVEILVAAVQGLGLLALGIELEASPIEIIDNR